MSLAAGARLAKEGPALRLELASTLCLEVVFKTWAFGSGAGSRQTQSVVQIVDINTYAVDSHFLPDLIRQLLVCRGSG